MSYFVVDIHQDYVPPNLKKWHGILDRKTLRGKKKNLIPKYSIFQTTHHMQTVFTDIILHPCFMVSEKVRQTIKVYEPSLRFEQITIVDSQTKKVGIYHIPILEELDALTSKRCEKGSMESIKIDGEKTKEKAIFRIENKKKIYVLAHLNLVESLLRRKVIGIDLRAIDII